MSGLLILMCVKGTPNFDNLPFLIIPEVIKTQLLGEPVKPFTSLPDESENFIVCEVGRVHLGVMTVGGCVRGHLLSLL